MEKQKIEQSQYKIRRIQAGYEADPPIYTTDEVNIKMGSYRDLIYLANTEIQRLQDLMEQTAIGRQTKETALKILESLRDTNLENASSDEKRNLMAQLGIKVYPSEDGKVVRIASNLQFADTPFVLSPQIMSIASPKL
jgi:hypothetical protein